MTEPPVAPRWAGVLFDLDGTLLDTDAAIGHAVHVATTRHLGRPVTDAEWAPLRSLPVARQMRALARLAAAGPRAEAELAARLEETLVATYLAEHDRRVRLLPGVAETLAALRGRGYRMGAVTSKHRETAGAAVRRFGLDRWLEAVITVADVARPKPDPGGVRLAAGRLGLPPGRVLVVGDSPVDIQAGRAAGAGTAGAAWGARDPGALRAAGPTLWLERPEDLLASLPPAGAGGAGSGGTRPPANPQSSAGDAEGQEGGAGGL